MSHSGYRKLDKLGEGTYGAVYKAMDKETGRIVALKRMIPMTEEEGIPATTIREIMLLKEMRHENIVRLHDVLFRIPKLTLVFEYCECDLKQLMDARPGKQLDPQGEVLPFMWQLISGLGYMHARSVIHRDIKPANILTNSVGERRVIKIADLGLGRVEGIPVKKYSHDAVTLWYRAPDIVLGSVNYGLPADIWSVGCVFAEMIAGQPLFCGRTDHEQLARMFRLLGTPTEEEWPNMRRYPLSDQILSRPEFERKYASSLENWVAEHCALEKVGAEGLNLLYRMLQFDPARRITAQEVLSHVYFAPFHRTGRNNSATAKVVRLPHLTPAETPEASRAPSPLHSAPSFYDAAPPSTLPPPMSEFRRGSSYASSETSASIIAGDGQPSGSSLTSNPSNVNLPHQRHLSIPLPLTPNAKLQAAAAASGGLGLLGGSVQQ